MCWIVLCTTLLITIYIKSTELRVGVFSICICTFFYNVHWNVYIIMCSKNNYYLFKKAKTFIKLSLVNVSCSLIPL